MRMRPTALLAALVLGAVLVTATALLLDEAGAPVLNPQHADATPTLPHAQQLQNAPSPRLVKRSKHAAHHHHHAHLAHSVRAAFGMTPIHPRPRAAVQAAHPEASAHRESGVDSASASVPASSLSMPGSRSASPPIRLPPLKLPSSPSSPLNRPEGVDKEARRRSLDGAVGEMSLREREHEREREREGAAGMGVGGGVGGKVELPGFSEFAAASGLGK